MMRTLSACLICALLLGCAPQIEPTDTSEVLTISLGGAFHGTERTQLYPDDVIRRATTKPFEAKEKVKTAQLKPGAFVAARGYLFANPIDPVQLVEKYPCEDYGMDQILYQGPDRQVSYGASCPNDDVSGLLNGLYRIISEYE